MTITLADILDRAPVIPVITINDPATAVPLARALLDGGISVLEITLRTVHGLDAIRRIRGEVAGAVVGAGTVLDERDMNNAIAVGSEFIISPGITPSLLAAGTACGVPFMPGIATVSELMCCLEKGLHTMKFFPAEAAGGVKTLKAFAGPFPSAGFCPTGGIGLDNLGEYLALRSVKSIGGSWIAPSALVDSGDWSEITRLAREATERVAELRAAGSGGAKDATGI